MTDHSSSSLSFTSPTNLVLPWRHTLVALGVALVMTACGGGESGGDASANTVAAPSSLSNEPSMTSAVVPPAPIPTSTAVPPSAGTFVKSTAEATDPAPPAVTDTTTANVEEALALSSTAPRITPTSARDAVRLADQATFGSSEPLIASIKAKGPAVWINEQMGMRVSSYTSGMGDAVHKYTGGGKFCDGKGSDCFRDWYSTQPLLWDFYRNAVNQHDQLRQRVAFALQQIFVVSNVDVTGTYGFRIYHNTLLDNAFTNYRQVLKKVALSPLMGEYLNNVNNDKSAPNENFARELLQLFTIGTCELNIDGSLRGGECNATYTNDTVRSYAYALTGWTYPPGGATPWGCAKGLNCRYFGGDMVPAAGFHDTSAHPLLSGWSVSAGSVAPTALENVLDSLMAHPNMAPFVSKQLIQHLVSSNPSPGYISRVASAFNSGKFQSFGKGQKGDMAATVAAVLLDAEARGSNVSRTAGKLREPVNMFVGVLRGLGGKTDGDALAWWWGKNLSQHVFRAPSVFNDFPPDYPVAGTTQVGPAFGIQNASTALERLNYLTYLIQWNGSAPESNVPNAIGTSLDLLPFYVNAGDAAALVDRFSMLALGELLPSGPRAEVIKAVSWWTPENQANNWKKYRVQTAAYLVFASPNYQVVR